MEKTIAISKVKVDPNQPRKYKDQAGISALAENISKHGLINRIEIDKDNYIVTGEMRMHACKKLGWTEIPCAVVNVPPEMRFARQLSENIHQNTMDPMDVAEAVKKLYKENDKSPKKVGALIGRSVNFVRDQLELVNCSQAEKTAMRRDKIKPTSVLAVKKIPEQYQEPIRKKVLQNEIKTATAVNLIGSRIKERPDKAEEIINEDYSNDSPIKVIDKLSQIAPSHSDKYYSDKEYFRAVEATARKLLHLLQENPCGKEKGSKYLLEGALKGTAILVLDRVVKAVDVWKEEVDNYKDVQGDIIEG